MSDISNGRVAIVAGNSEAAVKSIIGSLLAERVSVIYPAKSASAIQAIKKELSPVERELFTGILIDYPDYEQATDLIESVIERSGKIDMAVVCLGTHCNGLSLTETTFIDWDKMIDLNITPFFISARLILHHMMQNKSGLFVSLRTVPTDTVHSNCPLSRISHVIQNEMSNIFRSEAKSENIECIHLVASEPLKLTSEASLGSANADSNGIGSTIVDLFKRNIARTNDKISIRELNNSEK